MIIKNLQIASRFLLKHREYTFINIGGLAFSLVCVFFISLYLYDELSFDRMHSDHKRIYRVVENTVTKNGEEIDQAEVAFRLSNIQDEIPQIEHAAKLTSFGRRNISDVDKNISFHFDAIYADHSFLEIFDYPLVRGDRKTALKNANTVVLSESMARRIFGSIDVVGKTILSANDPVTVTGIFEDFPSNSHLKLDVLYSMETHASEDWYKRFQSEDWTSTYFVTYYKLTEGADPREVAQRITSLVKTNRPGDTPPFRFWLQPLTDIHFHSANIRGGGNASPGEIYYVYIFAAVGIFVLIIACVNYINLSTAFALTRGKEVGVKKVAGAHRAQLVLQFICESVLVTLISTAIALAAVNVLLPAFNDFTGKTIGIGARLLYQTPTVLVVGGFALVVGILSGAYPAFFLSKLQPVHAFKGHSQGRSSAWLRKGLVVFQFTLCIMLIIATITAYQQIHFIRNKNLGFNQEQLVVLDINSGKVRRGAETIKTELLRLPAAKHVAVTSRVPGEWKNLARTRVTTTENPEGAYFYFIGADEDFLETFEIELLNGRNFRPGKSDSLFVLVNESAAQALNVKEPGYEIVISSANYGVADEPIEKPLTVTVAGIVKDFNFQSLHQKIAPLIIAHSTNPIQSIDYFTVRLAPGNPQSSLKAIQEIFYQVDEDHPLEYNFLDQRLAEFYKEDLKRSELFGIAALTSVALACLGLFSLASFNTEQRTKEIGIRKVLGASVGQITTLLSREYVKLVLVGFLFAAPFSFWALKGWLSSFAYRINIGATILLTAGLLSLMIALLTVGYKSIRAAMSNPVKSLRSE